MGRRVWFSAEATRRADQEGQCTGATADGILLTSGPSTGLPRGERWALEIVAVRGFGVSWTRSGIGHGRLRIRDANTTLDRGFPALPTEGGQGGKQAVRITQTGVGSWWSDRCVDGLRRHCKQACRGAARSGAVPRPMIRFRWVTLEKGLWRRCHGRERPPSFMLIRGCGSGSVVVIPPHSAANSRGFTSASTGSTVHKIQDSLK